MSNFLAVDTSSKYLTVLACKDGRSMIEHLPECAMRHSRILMGEIDKVLSSLDLRPSECDFFAAVTGPGSFTGIRIGVSTVKGFAVACGKPAFGVTSFDLLAYNIKDMRPFGVVIDAMRGYYYYAGYSPEGRMTQAPCYLPAAEVEGMGVPLYGFEELPLPQYTRMKVEDCLFNAVCAARVGERNGLHALYVRKSQAEENADARP